MRAKKWASIAAVACLGVMGLAACSSGSHSASNLPATKKNEKVTLKFWGWAQYGDAVNIWNKTHPNTQVQFTQTPSTIDIYPKMFTAIKAKNAPCLAQIEYSALPNFIVQHGVEDISSLTKDMKKDFTPSAWQSVDIAHGVYGIPVDTAPGALLYRKDLFAKYGITPPKTWEEYKEDARKVKQQDPSVSLGYISNNRGVLAALAQQKGGKWFTLKNDAWKVSIDGKETQEVAKFWQSMIDDGLIQPEISFKPALYKKMSEGKILSEVFGIWDTRTLAQALKQQSGKWAVAPMPVWKDHPNQYENIGGSATSILKGCAHPDRAVEFAHWMSTNSQAIAPLIDKGGLWPASLEGLKSPQLDKGVAFYGGQKIYEPFKKISREIQTDWTWGPLQSQVDRDFNELLPKLSKNNTAPDALREVQKRAINDLKKRQLKVDDSSK